jgi:hypothetical protein
MQDSATKILDLNQGCCNVSKTNLFQEVCFEHRLHMARRLASGVKQTVLAISQQERASEPQFVHKCYWFLNSTKRNPGCPPRDCRCLPRCTRHHPVPVQATSFLLNVHPLHAAKVVASSSSHAAHAHSMHDCACHARYHRT